MDTGRKERFLALLEPVYPRLLRYALAMTHDREQARDLVSEAVLVALERFDFDREESGFPGFLYRIVARKYKKWHRRDLRFAAVDKSTLEAILDTNAMPDVAAEISIVMLALERLPAKMKETILLFDIGDLSLEEIRAIQGGTLSGVKSRLRRGREMLKKILGIDPEEDKSKKTNADPLGNVAGTHKIFMEAIENYAL
jgi:RNA polymerase sigma-70 factor (ECF subfamily)